MKLPCPHCGSDDSFHDRSADDFKPIVPVELQGNFEEPPPPIASPGSFSKFQNAKPISKTPESQVPSSSGVSIQKIDYKFEPTTSSKGTKGTVDYATDSRLENIEKTIKTIENEVRTFSSDLENIQKSQKVIESILTNINKKLLKLQKE